MRPLSMYGAALLLLALTVFVAVPVAAQGEITIQLAVNTFFQDVFEERVIPEFEAQNPGVKVHLVVLDGFGNPLNSGDTVTDYLDDAAEYLTGADVVPLDTSILRTATHAGYLLDLSPLADTDAALDAGDFYPSAYNAFRWDGGLWGLPVTVDAIQVYYDRQAFDEAGLSYPNGSWTVADYASAIRALTPLDSDGTPSELAVQVFGEASQYFFASLAGDVLDDSVLPNVPDYSSPVLAEVAEAWIALNQEGYLTPPSQGAVFTIGGDEEPVPLTIGGSNFAGAGPSSVDRIGVAPLPGNQTVVTASGYGVSAGTRYPEAAYALVKFLSASPDAAAFSFGGSPARRSVEPAANTGGPGGARLVVGGGNFSAEVQAAIDLALETGRPAADFAFSNGLESAMQTVLSGTTSLEMALQEAEAGILSDLQTADQRRSTPLVVDAPPAPVVVAQGEVALNFAVSTFVNPLPNQELWEQLAAEFSAQDPQVGAVIISSEQPFGPGGQTDLNAEYECYIASNNPVTEGEVLDAIRSLDPLLQSDLDFDPNDLYAGVLAQLQRDGMTWGVPVALSPEALDFDPELFEAAGVPSPVTGWTVSDFELALRLLNEFSGETSFVPSALNTTYISTLIAAYGGIPYDTRTEPATLNYTDPSSIAAIQQVLDLVVSGYISYQPFTGGRGEFSLSATQDAAISTATVGQGGFASFGGGRAIAIFGGGQGGEDAPVRGNAPYPTGTTVNGASYSVIAGFVSAQTANVEPCYRWLRFISAHPELFDGMPVSRTQVSDPALDSAVGSDTAAFFRSFGALLDSPGTQVIDAIPTSFGIPTDSYWLLKVFDDYVAAEGDLDLAFELAEAERMTNEFRQCTAGLPALTPGRGGGPGGGEVDFREIASQWVACAVSVDPEADGAFQFQ